LSGKLPDPKVGDVYFNVLGLLQVLEITNDIISYEYLTGDYYLTGNVFRRYTEEWNFTKATPLIEALC